jgi:hypothetical protein
MNTPHTTNSSGYAILFSVLLVSIILAITMGIANVALKELQFTNTARNAHISFFAADSVGECALYQYRKNNLLQTGGPTDLTCGNTTIPADNSGSIDTTYYRYFDVDGGCGIVDITIVPTQTTINARGYNISCTQLQSDPSQSVERLLTYVFNNASSQGATGGVTGGSGSPTTGSIPLTSGPGGGFN